MKKFLFAAALISFFAFGAKAQSTYQSAIGARLGTGYADLLSASYKTFLAESPSAIEFNFGFRPSYQTYDDLNLALSAAYQFHVPIPAVDGLQWFIGGGITGYYTFSSYNSYEGFGLGIFPTGGVDYKFADIPLNLSVDLRPTIRIVSPSVYDYSNFYFGNFGVSARYTLR
ncbi:MAG TPA: hypothetical protein VG890_07845 [Puia sp.]|nr:hypothetical protein [Puia sp.]